MKNLAWLSAVVLLLVPSASANSPNSHGSVQFTKQVCGGVVRFRTRSPDISVEEQYVLISVDRHGLQWIRENTTSAYWAGRSTFVQLKILNPRGFAWTALRTTPHCAMVRFSYGW